jgi:hypothetical protein
LRQKSDIDDVVEKKFDLTVHRRDQDSGEIVEVNPYSAHMMKTDGGTVTVFERPKGSGNCWDKFGNAAGRWDKDAPEGKRYDSKAEHVAFIVPLTHDQKLRAEMLAKEEKNKQLEREIAALRAERGVTKAPAQAKVETGAKK